MAVENPFADSMPFEANISPSIDDVDAMQLEIDNLHFEMEELRETVENLRSIIMTSLPQPPNQFDDQRQVQYYPQPGDPQPQSPLMPSVYNGTTDNTKWIKNQLEMMDLDPQQLMTSEAYDAANK